MIAKNIIYHYQKLLYTFFERNSLIYLKKNFLNEKKGHLKLFKECSEFLYKLYKNSISQGLTYITQLFCVAYIKTFCYTFIKLHSKKKFNPENVIKIINECDKINMIKLYIYKIIYNKNNKQINVFINNKIKKKYKLETYNGFNEFFKAEEIEKLEQFTYDDNKTNIFKKLKEFGEKQFEDKITKNDINPKRKEFDIFYMAAYKLILSKSFFFALISFFVIFSSNCFSSNSQSFLYTSELLSSE